jgi:hypothetical protein
VHLCDARYVETIPMGCLMDRHMETVLKISINEYYLNQNNILFELALNKKYYCIVSNSISTVAEVWVCNSTK